MAGIKRQKRFPIGYRIQNGRAEVVPEGQSWYNVFFGIIWKDLPLMELQSG